MTTLYIIYTKEINDKYFKSVQVVCLFYFLTLSGFLAMKSFQLEYDLTISGFPI